MMGNGSGRTYLVSNPAGKLFAFTAFVIDHVDRIKDAGIAARFDADLYKPVTEKLASE